MLESPGSLDFIYELLYGPRTATNFLHNGQLVESFGANDDVNVDVEDRHKLAKRALGRLSQSIMFRFEGDYGEHRMEGSNGATYATFQSGHLRGINITEDSGEPQGIASLIILHQKFVTQLSQLRSRPGNNKLQIKHLQFRLAVLIGHEVIHALCQARDGALLHECQLSAQEGRPPVSSTTEPFRRDEIVSEPGSSWENQLFGGKITSHPTNLDAAMLLTEWPSHMTHSDYYPTRGEYNDEAMQYIIPLHFIRQMHRHAFWAEMGDEDSTALYIKKIVGMRRRLPEIESDPNRPREGWRMQPESQLADPSASKANETSREHGQRLYGEP